RAMAANGTTTALTPSKNPSCFGDSVIFTASVTKTGGSGTPTGTVTFKDGASTLGTGTLTGNGGTATTTLTNSSLSAGTHSITAEYAGDANFNGSTNSPALSQTVNGIITQPTAQSVCNGASASFTVGT